MDRCELYFGAEQGEPGGGRDVGDDRQEEIWMNHRFGA